MGLAIAIFVLFEVARRLEAGDLNTTVCDRAYDSDSDSEECDGDSIE